MLSIAENDENVSQKQSLKVRISKRNYLRTFTEINLKEKDVVGKYG